MIFVRLYPFEEGALEQIFSITLSEPGAHDMSMLPIARVLSLLSVLTVYDTL